MRLVNSSPLSHFYWCYTRRALFSSLCYLWCKVPVLIHYHCIHALYEPIPKRLGYCTWPFITCIKIRMYLFQLSSRVVIDWDLNKGWGWAIHVPVVARFLVHWGHVLSWHTACTQGIIKVWSCIGHVWLYCNLCSVVYGNAQGMYTQGIVIMLLHAQVTLNLIYRVHYPYHGSCLSKCALRAIDRVFAFWPPNKRLLIYANRCAQL